MHTGGHSCQTLFILAMADAIYRAWDQFCCSQLQRCHLQCVYLVPWGFSNWNVISGFHYLGPEWCVSSVMHNIDLHSTLTHPPAPMNLVRSSDAKEFIKLIVNLWCKMFQVLAHQFFLSALLSHRTDICYTEHRFMIQWSSWQSELLAYTMDWLMPLQQINSIGEWLFTVRMPVLVWIPISMVLGTEQPQPAASCHMSSPLLSRNISFVSFLISADAFTIV